MRGNNFGYFLIEGIKNVFIHKLMSFACISVIVACLIITGSFSLVALNVNRIISQAEQSNEILAFVDDSLTDQEALALGAKIYAIPNVKSAPFVTNEEALAEYGKTLGDDADLLLSGIESSDLRHRYRILMEDLSLASQTAEAVKAIPGIGSVQHSVELSESVLGMRNAVNIISMILAAILVFVSIFIISNTVKLATFDRREEIAIMKIVGASNAFIRWPFVVEGFLLGTTGGIAAYIIQWGLYRYAVDLIAQYANIGGMIGEFIQFSDYAAPIAFVFVAAGFIVGVGGGVMTIRKFMKV